MAKNKNNITVKTQNGISINASNVSQPQSSTIQSAPARLNNTFNNINSGPPNNTVVTPLNSNNRNANQNSNNNPYEIFYTAIKKLYFDYITDPITHTLTGCSQLYPDKPGYSRGWIFNGVIPTFAPCGCYVEAVWPVFFNVGLLAKNLARNVIVKNLRRQCLIDFLYKIGEIVNKNYFIRRNWRAIKQLGVDTGYGFASGLINRSLRVLNIPPVQPGFTRLYRAQGGTNLAQVASDSDPMGTGRWFQKEAASAIGYIDPDLVPASSAFGWVKGKYPNGHLVYIDVPTPLVKDLTQSYPLLTNVSAIDEITGKTIDGLSQTRWGSWSELFGGNGKTVIKRLNQSGDEILVYGIPKETDLALNPGIFTHGEITASKEVFLDSPLANQAKKIAACRSLSSIKEFDELFKKLDNFTLMGHDRIFLLNTMPADIQSPGIDAAEKWLSDANFRARKTAEWKSLLAEFKKLKDDHLDNLPTILQETIDAMDQLLEPGAPILRNTNVFANILGFIINVLDVTTVVENKKCGPKYYMHSGISDVLRFIGAGLIGSTYVPPQSRIRDSDWDLIRNKLIQDEARIFWAELDDNCDCNSCPENYNLCDKPINFFTDYYNTCQRCQECLNDNFQPIYAENSTKPILLSDKSIQSYRPLPVTGNVFDPETGLAIKDDGCICECEVSNIIRRDKDNKLVSRGRKLKDYRPNTGNPFEDFNCYSYTDGPNKVNINIVRNQNSNQGGIVTIDPNLIIPPNIGQLIPAIPYETIQNRQVCDLSTPPDGLPEFPKFSLFSSAVSAYRWDSVLGMWQCKKIKGCLSPMVFTHGVASNGEYCDCTNVDLSSSSSSSSEIVEPGSFFGCNFESASVNGQYNYFDIHNNHSAYNNGDNIIFYKDANGWVITPFVFDDSDIYNSNILYKNTNENIISSSWIDMSVTISSSSSQILSSGITQTSNC